MNCTTLAQHDTTIADVQNIITAFLSKYKHVEERRIQNLLYNAELYALAAYDTRFTTLDFYPYMHGVTSNTVHEALQSLSVETDTVVKNGVTTQRYLSYGVSPSGVSPREQEIITRVHNHTKTTSTTELIQEVKETWLWNTHDFSEALDFNAYQETVLHSTTNNHDPLYNQQTTGQ